MNRRNALAAIGAAAAAAIPRFARSAAPATVPVRAMRVPLDHDARSAGSFSLQYLSLWPFDRRKPTVVVVSDGQQFFITPEAFGPTTEPLFDDRFNVVGVLGRGGAPEIQSRIGYGTSTNWVEAYRLLRARQWIGDVESLRATLVGAGGKILLYGRSGGAAMVHQYAARYGEHAERIFTQAAVDNALEARYNLEPDRFWDEISPEDRTALSRVLSRDPASRATIIAVLQRQNFFVDRAHLPTERDRLIRSLAVGKRDLLDRLVVDYQVAAIRKLEDSPLGPSIAVRVFELAAPFARRYDYQRTDRIYPDHESTATAIAPLVQAANARQIEMPAWDHGPLHSVRAPVVMLAGRWDHTCDYRSQIALASCYPSSRLFVLDDDHTFHAIRESGRMRDITVGALSAGGSAAYESAMAALEPFVWRE